MWWDEDTSFGFEVLQFLFMQLPGLIIGFILGALIF
jgi:hypothetical protein